jgi:hypothetical protein
LGVCELAFGIMFGDLFFKKFLTLFTLLWGPITFSFLLLFARIVVQADVPRGGVQI